MNAQQYATRYTQAQVTSVDPKRLREKLPASEAARRATERLEAAVVARAAGGGLLRCPDSAAPRRKLANRFHRAGRPLRRRNGSPTVAPCATSRN